MSMYNLLYYSKNFRETTGSFWNYYPDKPKSGRNDDDNLRQRIIYPIKDLESLDYRTKLVGNLPGAADVANNDVETELEHIKIIVLLNYYTQNCVLTKKATREPMPAGDDPAAEPLLMKLINQNI